MPIHSRSRGETRIKDIKMFTDTFIRFFPTHFNKISTESLTKNLLRHRPVERKYIYGVWLPFLTTHQSIRSTFLTTIVRQIFQAEISIVSSIILGHISRERSYGLNMSVLASSMTLVFDVDFHTLKNSLFWRKGRHPFRDILDKF